MCPRRSVRSTTIVAIAALVAATAITDRDDARAEIDGATFTSDETGVRMTLPRGWRISEQPSYPGVVLRMFKTRPRITILLAVDARPTSIDETCTTRPALTPEGAPGVLPIEQQIACQQARRLSALGFAVGPIKDAARPWFDYAADGRELRQGVVVHGAQVVTLVMAADTAAARAQYARTFDKALRSIRITSAAERDEDGTVAPSEGDGGDADRAAPDDDAGGGAPPPSPAPPAS